MTPNLPAVADETTADAEVFAFANAVLDAFHHRPAGVSEYLAISVVWAVAASLYEHSSDPVVDRLPESVFTDHALHIANLLGNPHASLH